MEILVNGQMKLKYINKENRKKKYFILIGSSMGSWIALNQFKYFEKQIKGFLGIGSATRIFRKTYVEKIYKKNEKRNY